MKETGIIMSGNHPRLVMNGLKTMTRRTYGLERINQNPDAWVSLGSFVDGYGDRWRFRRHGIDEEVIIKCPYGGIGDRLWVRETFDYIFGDEGDYLIYKADKESAEWFKQRKAEGSEITWKPSIHMFRKDSRAVLENTAIRAERVQEITEEDAQAEGIQPLPEQWDACYTDAFIRLWDSLNAKRGYGWDFNPWVWPISFKLITDYKVQ